MKFSVSKALVGKRKSVFESMCIKHALRCTPQKESIYMTLAKTQEHPSAQEIFEEVQKTFSSISFATVYKNLLLFQKHNIIQELDFGEGFSRYDAHTENHHHVYDRTQKTVLDIDANSFPLPKELAGKNVEHIQLTYFVR